MVDKKLDSHQSRKRTNTCNRRKSVKRRLQLARGAKLVKRGLSDSPFMDAYMDVISNACKDPSHFFRTFCDTFVFKSREQREHIPLPFRLGMGIAGPALYSLLYPPPAKPHGSEIIFDQTRTKSFIEATDDYCKRWNSISEGPPTKCSTLPFLIIEGYLLVPEYLPDKTVRAQAIVIFTHHDLTRVAEALAKQNVELNYHIYTILGTLKLFILKLVALVKSPVEEGREYYIYGETMYETDNHFLRRNRKRIASAYYDKFLMPSFYLRFEDLWKVINWKKERAWFLGRIDKLRPKVTLKEIMVRVKFSQTFFGENSPRIRGLQFTYQIMD